MEENDEIIQDAPEVSESSPDQSQDSTQETNNQQQASEPAVDSKNKADEEENVPFHMHPRFKQLVEEKNQERSLREGLEKRYGDLESQVKQLTSQLTPKQEDALIARLKGIDPAFGGRFEEMYSKVNKLEQIEQRIQQHETRAFTSDAVNTINSLHETNKVAPELRTLYNEALNSAYMNGQLKSQDDVKNVYKATHERYSKIVDGIKRAERASYVSDKKQDAAKPQTQQKGKPVVQGKAEFSKDPQQARQELVQRILQEARAEKNI